MAEKKEVRKRLTKRQKDFVEAYRKQASNISRACEKVGINRSTYHRWYKTNATLKEAVDEINESMIDFAESMLYKNMKIGKETSIIFYLKTRGKSRGYVEKQEIDLSVSEHKTLDDFYAEMDNED